MGHRYFIQLTLLGYMLVVLFVLTLSPFRFEFPEKWLASWWGDRGDVLNNVFLFVPLGYFVRLLLPAWWRGAFAATLLFGAAVSLAIETTQLFLPQRLTSLLDWLSNTIGAGAGAAFCSALRGQLERRLPGVLALDLPLINILYLLLPLMWLAGTGLGVARMQGWVLLPLGLAGALTLAGIWRFRLHRALQHRRTLLLAAAVWYLIGAVVSLRAAPATVGVCAGLVLMLGALPACVQGPWHGEERRFEGRVLRMVWPCFLVYLVLITIGIPPRLDASFDAVGLYPEIGFRRDFALRVVEQLGALTLLGYLIGESFGRSTRARRSTLRDKLLFGAVLAVLIEAVHGFRVDDRASLLRGALGITATWFGIALYAAQLNVVRLLIHAGDPDRDPRDPA